MAPTCDHCGSVLSSVTWTCVRGAHCPGERRPIFERVRLADGEADQALIPGVAAISASARDTAALQHARDARRGFAPMPAGGLFDETAKAQGELF